MNERKGTTAAALTGKEGMRPFFSVIIPTYNRARFVSKAIDSVVRQTGATFEIIVIDDGSTDDTSDVLRRYGNAITVLRQENAGVSAARNAGIEASRGAWIAFLDSDDEWRPGYLLRQAEHSRSHPHAVAHITNAVTLHRNGTTDIHFQGNIARHFRKKDHIVIERPFRVILSHTHWYLQATIIRRDVLYASGLLNPRLTIAEDLDVIARVSLQGPFGLSREILVETHRRPETIRNLALQREQEGIRTYEMFESVYAGLDRMDRLDVRERTALAKATSANLRALGNACLRQGDRFRARACYKKAMAAFPSARSLVKYMASFLPAKASRKLLLK
jgi:glycosyltransferase involved in cell wall biosynthesis